MRAGVTAVAGLVGLILIGVGVAINNGRVAFAGIGCCFFALLWGQISG